jgi:hypothetical protein
MLAISSLTCRCFFLRWGVRRWVVSRNFLCLIFGLVLHVSPVRCAASCRYARDFVTHLPMLFSTLGSSEAGGFPELFVSDFRPRVTRFACTVRGQLQVCSRFRRSPADAFFYAGEFGAGGCPARFVHDFPLSRITRFGCTVRAPLQVCSRFRRSLADAFVICAVF